MKKAQTSQIIIASLMVLAGVSLILTTSFNGAGFTKITGHDVFISSAPVVSNVILNSTHRTNYTTNNFTVHFTESDSDGDPLTNTTDWRINGTSIMLLNMPFEANGTSNASDYSGHGEVGTVQGNALWNKTGGYNGFGAYLFDGSNDDILIPSISLSNTHTITMWVNPHSGGCAGDYANLIAANDGNNGVYYHCSNRKIDYFYSSADHNSAKALTLNSWNYVVVRSNAGNVNYFINGVIDSNSYTGAQPYFPSEFGRDSFNSPFSGYIDEVKVFNRSLSAEQIKALYHNQTNFLVHNETAPGNNWTAAVTLNDGTSDSATVLSNSLITRAPPCIDSDGDGFNTTSVCGPVDCNDNNANVIPLRNNFVINRSVTLCSGTYNLNNGSIITRSNTVVTCNNTVINGTNANNGLSVSNLNNVTIRNCVVKNYKRAFNFFNSANLTIFRNNASNSTRGFIVNLTRKSNFTNNLLSRTSIGIMIINSTRNKLFNLTFTSPTPRSIFTANRRTNNTFTFLNRTNRFVFANKFINFSSPKTFFLDFTLAGANTTLTPNMNQTANSTMSVSNCSSKLYTKSQFTKKRSVALSGAVSCADCTVLSCSNRLLTFTKTSWSTVVSNVNPSFSGPIANRTWQANTNKTINLSLYFSDQDRDTLTYNFTPHSITNLTVRITQSTGIVNIIPDHDFSATNRTIRFNATDGLNYTLSNRVNLTILGNPLIKFISPNQTNKTIQIANSTNNISIGIKSGVNTTYNITAEDVNSNVLTFRWFVDGTLKLIQTVTNTLTSIFSSVFHFEFTGGSNHNVVAVVNDSTTNDTFRFSVGSCTDLDGDGFNSTGCGPRDCNDNNVNIRPPRSGEIISSNVTYCPGIFTVPLGVSFNGTSRITVNCNNTIFNGSSGNIGFEINQSSAILIKGCTLQNYGTGIQFYNSSKNNIFNNKFYNTSIGITLTFSSKFNNITNNNFTKDSSFGINIQEPSSPSQASINNTVRNSTFRQNAQGIFLRGTFNSGMMFLSNKFFRNGGGITIDRSNINKILNSTFTNNPPQAILLEGFSSEYCHDNIVSRNNITNSSTGIKLDHDSFGASCYNNKITNNILTNNNLSGIHINVNVNNNDVTGNNISGSHTGIIISGSASNNIISNALTNVVTGVLFQSGTFGASTSNNISQMTFNNVTTAISSTTSSQTNTLILVLGGNLMIFKDKVVNLTKIDNNTIFIGERIAASKSSNFNTSAEIIFSGLADPSIPNIYRFGNYTASPDTVIAKGMLCPSTICTNQTYDSSTGTLRFNVSEFSSYAVPKFLLPGGSSGSSGTGNGPALAPNIPFFSPPQITTPVVESPQSSLTTSINPEFTLGNVACVENITTSEVNSIGAKGDYSSLINGYSIIIPSFKVDCTNPSLKLTLSVPDSYTNISALRCSAGNCESIVVNQVNTLDCGSKIFPDVSRKTSFLSPDAFPVKLEHRETQPGANEISDSNTLIKFTGSSGKVILDKASTNIPEAKNTRIRIVGTPTVLTFENSNSDMNVTLPYVLPDHVDELSISIFALQNNTWKYLGGNVDTKAKTVTYYIKNPSQYSENNKLTLATMGLICLNCINARLDKVYDGGSRDAVVLVHGFENTPERFQDIINDIKLTKQPWQAWTFGYPSNKPIEDNGKALADLLQAHVGEYDFIYLTGHSLGGLVTQEALNYAYEQNKGKNNPPYTFLKKVVKIVSVATPNKGALTQNPNNLFNALLNNDAVAGLFNLNSIVVNELISGKEIPRVPGVEYLAIAGTLPYSFSGLFGISGKNDGLVSLNSAQTIGGELVNNYCSNFWAINTTHTDILNNFDSRKIVERIVSKEINQIVPGKAVIGHEQYYDLRVYSCNPSDEYIIVGNKLNEKAQPNPGLCSCGNGVCGVDENSVNCPSDCAVIAKPSTSIWDLILRFAPLRNLVLSLLIIFLLIVLVSRRRNHPEQASVVVHEMENKMSQSQATQAMSDKETEDKLNQLIFAARISIRTGDYDKAELSYNHFSVLYSTAPTKLKEKFYDVGMKLRKEIMEKMK